MEPSMFTYSAWSKQKAPNAPTAIEEGEMMMPGIPCLSVQHFNCTGRMWWPPYKKGWTASYTGQFGPNYTEEQGWMGPGGCLCRFDSASRNGDSAGVAEVANSHRHPAPDAGPHPLPCLPLATQQWKKKTIQAGLLHRLMAATNT